MLARPASICRLTVLLLAACAAAGCVRRTLTIQTEPEGALVYLNDEEVGRGPATVDFTWYGDYDVLIRKKGYRTLKTHVKITEPWYQVPPIDFIAEVLWPGQITDARFYSFELEPQVLPDREEVLQRAREMRDRALSEAD